MEKNLITFKFNLDNKTFFTELFETKYTFSFWHPKHKHFAMSSTILNLDVEKSAVTLFN